MSRPGRRFYRRAEIVVGYDEQVLQPREIAAARDAWRAPVPVRTMPFVRGQADLGAPLLITFGTLAVEAPPAEACRLLAAALRDAIRREPVVRDPRLRRVGVRPRRVMVRFDYRGVIVRGNVSADRTELVERALATLPELAAQAQTLIDALLDEPPEGRPGGTPGPRPTRPSLLVGRFDEFKAAWRIVEAHGYADHVWHRRLTDDAEPTDP
jgi:hypothetical protein